MEGESDDDSDFEKDILGLKTSSKKDILKGKKDILRVQGLEGIFNIERENIFSAVESEDPVEYEEDEKRIDNVYLETIDELEEHGRYFEAAVLCEELGLGNRAADNYSKLRQVYERDTVLIDNTEKYRKNLVLA